MYQFLEINCQEIELSKQNKQITLLIKGKIRLSLKGKFNQKLLLLNKDALVEKQTIYAQLFKSEVVYPPPPVSVLPATIIQAQPDKNQTQQSQNSKKQRQKLQNQVKQEPKPYKDSERPSIFGRAPQQRINQEASSGRMQQSETRGNIFQTNPQSNWRNSIFTDQNQRSDENRNRNTFVSSSNVTNTYNQGGSNMFAMNQQSGPSLFSQNQSNYNTSQYSNNTRRNKNKHQRIA